MHKLILLLILIPLYRPARSQNIFTALHLNEEREYKTRKPKKIVETNTFFNPSGKHTDKNIKIFDEAGMLLTEERYDESGELKARLTYTNDTTRRIKLARIMERWNQFGHSMETAFYTYDKNFFLVATTDKDVNGNIIRQTNLVCNEKGHPIELSLFDGNGNLFGREIAAYLYDKNRVVTSVLNNAGRVLSSDTLKISFIAASRFPTDKEVYNSRGDLTNRVSTNLDGTETIYEEEYGYDQFDNCTVNKIFKVTIKPNGKRKRDNDRIFKKQYYY